MIRFNNDYNHGAHPKVLEALLRTNEESYGGYGLDEWCEKGANAIKKYLDCPEAKVHFLVGGTQANFTVIAALLRPYESIICADSAHINVHETGAVENTGHKIQALTSKNGKISAEQIAEKAREYRESGTKEHITEPRMVYLSFATEFGTIYSLKELEDIRRVCDEYQLYLFMDGARMGYGLGAEDADVKLSDIARLSDVFYCGGTKCGALFGEAVVFTKPELQTHFRSFIKQNGGMLAKGWLLGLQFYTLFEDGLYFEITKQADIYAMRIKKAFQEAGISSYIESSTNQQFVVLTKVQKEALAKNYVFEEEFGMDEEKSCVRFCTSWSTKAEEIAALEKDIAAL